MIISPIKLCNPSVADSGGALLSVSPQTTTKTTYLGFYMLQTALFLALDFDIFLVEHDPGRKAHKRMSASCGVYKKL